MPASPTKEAGVKGHNKKWDFLGSHSARHCVPGKPVGGELHNEALFPNTDFVYPVLPFSLNRILLMGSGNHITVRNGSSL